MQRDSSIMSMARPRRKTGARTMCAVGGAAALLLISPVEAHSAKKKVNERQLALRGTIERERVSTNTYEMSNLKPSMLFQMVYAKLVIGFESPLDTDIGMYKVRGQEIYESKRGISKAL